MEEEFSCSSMKHVALSNLIALQRSASSRSCSRAYLGSLVFGFSLCLLFLFGPETAQDELGKRPAFALRWDPIHRVGLQHVEAARFPVASRPQILQLTVSVWLLGYGNSFQEPRWKNTPSSFTNLSRKPNAESLCLPEMKSKR